ncbi:PLAT/LH2 domain-containing protein [Streptomyces syringium]|uniref:PLAT/LH2 domain-containing protein n=1 Tax=Streptomyces syringium TaxID=76729 RepID=UPI003455C20A
MNLAVGSLATSAEAAPVTYRVTIETSEDGTDNTVKARMFDASGRPSSWTEFDKSGYNDFERGDHDTYAIKVPSNFGRPAKLQLWKGGNDDWCFAPWVRVTSPDGVQGGMGASAAAAHLCLTEESEHQETVTASDGTTYTKQYYHHYLPPSPIDWPR